jgi:hypothetical protein
LSTQHKGQICASVKMISAASGVRGAGRSWQRPQQPK